MLHAEATAEAKALGACGFPVNVQLRVTGTVWLRCVSRDDGMGQVCQESTKNVLFPEGRGGAVWDEVPMAAIWKMGRELRSEPGG